MDSTEPNLGPRTGLKIEIPFTDAQIDSLNRYQADGWFHEFTCGNDSTHGALRAAEDGWHCPECDYHQTWAWTWMGDYTWVISRQELIDQARIITAQWGGGPVDRPIPRCPEHQEPIGDGRTCIACDGGVY